MQGKARHVYAGANTCVGFFSLYDSVFQDVERKYVIKGGPGTGKSSFMKIIGEALLAQGYDVEFLHCSSDSNSLDGMIAPALKLGLVDGTAPHVIDPQYPGAVDEIINLGDYWDRSALRASKQEIVELTNQIAACFRRTYELLAFAKELHDQWETYYIEGMNFQQADGIAQDLIEKVLGQEPAKNAKPQERHLFFGAATPEGARHFYDNLTGHLHTRYIVKGRPGTGKSTMMRKVAAAALEKNYDVEYFHCSFDPQSIDMIIIPALAVAFLDGTAPHVLDPSGPKDVLVDMYQCVDPKVYQRNLAEIQALEIRYNGVMKASAAYLGDARRLHDQLESYYVKAMDFGQINAKRDQLLQEILTLAKNQDPLGRETAAG